MERTGDVMEICALLQCLGFSVKSLDTNDANLSQDGAVKNVVINCQTSGLHVVLENNEASCTCPVTNKQNSGLWQVSGMTGGKQLDKEVGSSLLGTLPKAQRERASKELKELLKNVMEHNESIEVNKETVNRSASMVELKTPDKRSFNVKVETPTRYRSLDTLTTNKDNPGIPAPGPLQKEQNDITERSDLEENKKFMCRRQSTYTLSSTPGSMRRRNKTSSPIQPRQSTLMDGLISAEKSAEELRNKLSILVKDIMEDYKNESSMSSLVLDVSKISVLKGAESSKAQFASSPNLSGLVSHEDIRTNRLKKFESSSTSNLTSNRQTPGKTSKLRRLSPNIFKFRKDSPALKQDKIKQETKNKLNSIFKPKIVTPVRVPKVNTEASPNVSATKKKYSHIKSTIPRPSSKKE